MKLVTAEDEVQAGLVDSVGPLLARALRCAHDAARRIPGIGPRTQSNVTWDFWHNEFRRLTADRDDVRAIFRADGQTLEYEIGERFVVRFKKISGGRISRIPTKQSDAYYGQGWLFDDEASSLRLVAGYELDHLGEVACVCLACCSGSQVVRRWNICLEEPVSSVATSISEDRPTGTAISPKRRDDGAIARDAE